MLQMMGNILKSPIPVDLSLTALTNGIINLPADELEKIACKIICILRNESQPSSLYSIEVDEGLILCRSRYKSLTDGLSDTVVSLDRILRNMIIKNMVV